MNKKQSAIIDSIDKWIDIVNNRKIDFGTEDCALCLAYISNKCIHCPVKLKTGYSGCHKTPYKKWLIHHRTKHIDLNSLRSLPSSTKSINMIYCPTCEKIAIDFIKFLSNLL